MSTYCVYQTSWLSFQLVSLLEQHVLDEPAFLWPKQGKTIKWLMKIVKILFYLSADICIQHVIFLKLGHYFDPFFVVVVIVVVCCIKSYRFRHQKLKKIFEARQICRHFSLIFFTLSFCIWSLFFLLMLKILFLCVLYLTPQKPLIKHFFYYYHFVYFPLFSILNICYAFVSLRINKKETTNYEIKKKR